MGIGGKMYNWIMDFLLERTIQVRIGVEYSETYKIESGTPQGSVCSPVLFNIMINDIFDQVNGSVGKSLYADDGALWVRKMQNAIEKVEQWTLNLKNSSYMFL